MGKPDREFFVGDTQGKINKKIDMTLWSKRTALLDVDSLELHVMGVIYFLDSNTDRVRSI
ncbi:hypothetical protein PSA5_05775 [Pseudomonas syringae pv. actinidiae]|nr:hypothetical protein PSA5_05775 [Pseudomonas syringae pv. actinidiae]